MSSPESTTSLPASRALICTDTCVLALPAQSPLRRGHGLYSDYQLAPCEVLCQQHRWDVLVATHGVVRTRRR